jgi:hypothetical protein
MATTNPTQNSEAATTDACFEEINIRFTEMIYAIIALSTLFTGERQIPHLPQPHEFPDQPQGEGRKPNWKTAEVGYFWPDIPKNMGLGRIVDYKGDRYFRDVNVFILRIEYSIPHHGAELMHNKIHHCLRGEAFIWYNDFLGDTMKLPSALTVHRIAELGAITCRKISKPRRQKH